MRVEDDFFAVAVVAGRGGHGTRSAVSASTDMMVVLGSTRLLANNFGKSLGAAQDSWTRSCAHESVAISVGAGLIFEPSVRQRIVVGSFMEAFMEVSYYVLCDYGDVRADGESVAVHSIFANFSGAQ